LVINTAALTAGEPLQDAEIIQGTVAAATTFTKGDVVIFDGATDAWIRAGAGATGDFGVAMEDAVATAAAKKVRIQVGGRVTVVFGGACLPGNAVMMSATAGRVIEYTAANTVADIDKKVGWYSGQETGSDRDGVTIPAIAANGDIGIITLRGRGGRF